MNECSLCQREDVQAMNAALTGGESLRAIADRFGVSKTTLIRHKDHVAGVQEQAEAPAGDAPQAAPGSCVDTSKLDALARQIERSTAERPSIVAHLQNTAALAARVPSPENTQAHEDAKTELAEHDNTHAEMLRQHQAEGARIQEAIEQEHKQRERERFPASTLLADLDEQIEKSRLHRRGWLEIVQERRAAEYAAEQSEANRAALDKANEDLAVHNAAHEGLVARREEEFGRLRDVIEREQAEKKAREDAIEAARVAKLQKDLEALQAAIAGFSTWVQETYGARFVEFLTAASSWLQEVQAKVAEINREVERLHMPCREAGLVDVRLPKGYVGFDNPMPTLGAAAGESLSAAGSKAIARVAGSSRDTYPYELLKSLAEAFAPNQNMAPYVPPTRFF